MTTHVEMLRGMLEEYDYDGFTLERAALEAAIAALNALPALQADARRYRFLRGRASQKTAYDIFGDGGHWLIGVPSADNRLSIDAAIDAASEREGNAND